MEWMENEMLSQQKHTPVINTMRGDAASIRTRASVAGSFLSRASNVIQIAFIPGVINRSNGGSSHNSLAPVPPIPAQYANNKPKSPLANDGDFLLFRPGSTFSATSSRSGVRDTQYTQYTYGSRQSITPSLARSSMALEIYRDEGTPPPMPATTMLRAAPRMVSVRSTPGTTPNPNGTYDSPGNTPRTGTSATIVPQGFGSSPQHSRQHSRTHSRRNSSMSLSSNKGKGRFPVRSASADLTMSPPPLSGRRTPTVSSPLITTNLDSEDDEGSNPGDDDDDHARARQSLLQPSSATTRTESGSPTSPMTHSSSMRPMSSIMLANNPYTLDPTSTSSSFMQGGAFRTASNPPPQPITSPFFDASDLPPNSTQPINIHNPASSQRPNPYANMSSAVASTSPPKRHVGAAKSFGGLGAVIEEAARKGSMPSSRAGSGPGSIVGVGETFVGAGAVGASSGLRRENGESQRQGPFGDEHELSSN
jgi:hypothetical protein